MVIRKILKSHMKLDVLFGNFVQGYLPIGEPIECLLAQSMTQWSLQSRLNHVPRYLVDAGNMTETKIVLGSRFLESPPRHMCSA